MSFIEVSYINIGQGLLTGVEMTDASPKPTLTCMATHKIRELRTLKQPAGNLTGWRVSFWVVLKSFLPTWKVFIPEETALQNLGMHVHVCVCAGTHAYINMWRAEVNIGAIPQESSTIFLTRVLSLASN